MTAPLIISACADCGVGTITAHEWYMVKDSVWKDAWRGRLKSWRRLPGQQVLCIACLEERLGRTLIASDFTDAPVNDASKCTVSERLRRRLTAIEPVKLREPVTRRRGRPRGSKNRPGSCKPGPKPRRPAT